MANTVLVVDDDPVVHRVLQHYLKRAGYEIAAANDGQGAIDMATRDVPRLIIMDVMLPNMSGLEALRQLKDAESTKAIPVLVLTSNPQRANELESTASGAAAFLTKPFTEADLLSAVRQLTEETKPGSRPAGSGDH